MDRKQTNKIILSVITLSLCMQVGSPIVGNTIKKENERAYLLQDSSTVITKEASQWNFQAMKAQLAWAEGFTGKGVKIAVIDSGIAPHPDLKIAGGVSTVDGDERYTDDYGHGTHVAGIINSQPNGIGLMGIAPDASIYAVKAIQDKNSGKIEDVVEGIQWAIDNEMDIINLSVGAKTDSDSLRKVIQKAYQAGIIIVSASGNNGDAEVLSYPASYPEVIAVSAVNKDLNRADFSARGVEIDFTAPGVDVVSTYLNGKYALISGTSQATPHIVGILALLKEKYPQKSNRELENLLQSLVQDLGEEGRDPLYGHGFVSYTNLINSDVQVSTPTTSYSIIEENFTPLQEKHILYAERYIGYVESYKRTSYGKTAQIYIDKLPEGNKKTELNRKLEDAINKVNGTTPSPSIETLVTKDTLAEVEQNKIAEESFTTQQQSFITYAERYIEYVKKYKRDSYGVTAQAYINKLPESQKKTELQRELELAIATITS